MVQNMQNDWLSTLNQFATSILDNADALVREWLFAVHQRKQPYRLYEYIEGMLADYEELKGNWVAQGHPAILILVRSVRPGLQIICGISRLLLGQLRHMVSLVCYGAEQIIVAMATPAASRSLCLLGVRLLLQMIHHATGSVGSQNGVKAGDRARLILSPSAHVIGWDDDAQAMFGFRAGDVIGHHAVGTFVPYQDSNGCLLPELLRNVCQMPEQYGLNINENQSQKGDRFWVFWINLPQYDDADTLKETICLGTKIDDPALIQVLINAWKLWQGYFLQRYPRPIASPVE